MHNTKSKKEIPPEILAIRHTTFFECVAQKYDPNTAMIYGCIYDMDMNEKYNEFRETIGYLEIKANLSYATVNRILKTLLEDNLIIDSTPERFKYDRQRIKHYITNPDELNKVSDEMELLLDKSYDEDGIRHITTVSEFSQESKIAKLLKIYILDKYNSEIEYKVFINPKTGHYLPYDIYIYNNIFIEVHGPQHYIYTQWFFKTQEEFEYRQHLDFIKKEYAEQNGIYIEIDLRKIRTIEKAIEYLEKILSTLETTRKE